MKYRVRFLGLIIVVFALFSCQPRKKSALQDKERVVFILDSLMHMAYDRDLFNGNILIADGEGILYKSSFGFTDGKMTELLDERAIFSVGSISKEFHAASILLLIEDGHLNWSDNLAMFDLNLPSWAGQVTIRHLFNYASGLPQLNFRTVKNENDLFTDLRGLSDLSSKPGTEYSYTQNTSIIFKRIIEEVSGDTFVNFVRDRFLKPLGMSSSVFNPVLGEGPAVHSFNDVGVDDNNFNPFRGWLFLTSGDMYRWIRGLHTGKVVSRELVEEALKNNFFDGRSTALGVGIFKDEKLVLHWHNGGFYNFRALIESHFDTSLFVVMMTNGRGRQLRSLAANIDSIYRGKPFEPPRRSVYWALRDTSAVDAEGAVAYYRMLKKDYVDEYDFDDADNLLFLGRRLLDEGLTTQALTIINLAVKEFENYTELYITRGDVYLQLNEYSKAKEDYLKAGELGAEAELIEEKMENIHL